MHAEPSFRAESGQLVRRNRRNRTIPRGLQWPSGRKFLKRFKYLLPAPSPLKCAPGWTAVDPITTQVIQRDRHAQYHFDAADYCRDWKKYAMKWALQRTSTKQKDLSAASSGSSRNTAQAQSVASEQIAASTRAVSALNAVTAAGNRALLAQCDISHSSGSRRIILPVQPYQLTTYWPKMTEIVSSMRVFLNATLIPESLRRPSWFFR